MWGVKRQKRQGCVRAGVHACVRARKKRAEQLGKMGRGEGERGRLAWVDRRPAPTTSAEQLGRLGRGEGEGRAGWLVGRDVCGRPPTHTDVLIMCRPHSRTRTLNRVFDGESTPAAPAQSAKAEAKLVRALRAWQADPKGPPQLAVMLNHQYTDSGLNASTLKGEDRATLAFLRKAAAHTDVDVFVANVEKYETGTGEGGESDYYGRRHWSDDEIVMHEVHSVEYTLSACTQVPASDGGARTYTPKMLDEEDFADEDAFEGEEPDKEEAEATGNEGTLCGRPCRRAQKRRERMAGTQADLEISTRIPPAPPCLCVYTRAHILNPLPTAQGPRSSGGTTGPQSFLCRAARRLRCSSAQTWRTPLRRCVCGSRRCLPA